MTFLRNWLQITSGLAFLLILHDSCKPRVKYLKSPAHYDFSKPAEHKLDNKLREISGVTWDSRRNEFVCHNDESGKLFYYDREIELINRVVEFAGKDDYEDIALVKGIPYVLRSDGMITKVITDSSGKTYGIEAGKIAISGSKDFETMYYDTTRKALIVICKNCGMDDKSTVSAFAFYTDSIGFDNRPVFTIDADEVRRLAPQKSSKFQPSAAAIHPKLNQLFIISSASNQLVIADRNGNVEGVYVLSKKLFPQPEGITFRNNGDMYISNEGVTGLGTIIRFSYIL